MKIKLKERIASTSRFYPNCKISQALIDILPKDCANKVRKTFNEDQVNILRHVGFNVHIEVLETQADKRKKAWEEKNKKELSLKLTLLQEKREEIEKKYKEKQRKKLGYELPF